MLENNMLHQFAIMANDVGAEFGFRIASIINVAILRHRILLGHLMIINRKNAVLLVYLMRY